MYGSRVGGRKQLDRSYLVRSPPQSRRHAGNSREESCILLYVIDELLNLMIIALRSTEKCRRIVLNSQQIRMPRLIKLRRRRLRLCLRDVFGTRERGREMVKTTPLGKELILRTRLRIINATFFKQIPGIGGWEEYRSQVPTLEAHMAIIHAALRRYKARRIERGLFHFVPKPDSVSFWLLSPMGAPPGAARREAMRKWRRWREKRKAVQSALLGKRSSSSSMLMPGCEMMARLMRPSALLYFAYLVSVAAVGIVVLLRL
ncbi:hypothetical protein EJB05_40207, partial [Eragrostis curvula]